jgi:zinc/manganese transport system substrate-binding protein
MGRFGRGSGLVAATVLALVSGLARADDKPVVVATFSILADLTQRVGGEHISVTTLVGPDGDAHVFEPGASESATLADADLIIANGLGLEPWLLRIRQSANFKGRTITVSDGIAPDRRIRQDGIDDPHAFQDLANAQIYVASIAQALSETDPAHAADFKANADTLTGEMAVLDAELKAKFTAIPPEQRRVLTSHDAFRYFGRAYGLEFVSAQGISTEAEPTAADLARIVRQVREGRISMIFVENMADPRLAETVAQEAVVQVGGELYADALSGPDGPAPDYLLMMRFNAGQLLAAMQ